MLPRTNAIGDKKASGMCRNEGNECWVESVVVEAGTRKTVLLEKRRERAEQKESRDCVGKDGLLSCLR